MTRTFLLSGLVALLLVAPARAQTARQFYEELKAANGLNALATLACFPEDENVSFSLVAISSQFAATLESKGLPVPKEFREFAKTGSEPLLFWQGFHKGVPADPWFMDRSEQGHWIFAFAVGKGKDRKTGNIDIVMNWATLRYKMDVQVEAVHRQSFGRCETIANATGPPN